MNSITKMKTIKKFREGDKVPNDAKFICSCIEKEQNDISKDSTGSLERKAVITIVFYYEIIIE